MKIKLVLLALLFPLVAFGQKKISQFPNTTSLDSNQLFIVTAGSTNNNISFGQVTNMLRNAAGLTNLNVAKLTDAGTAAYSNSASFASAQQGTIATNNGTFDLQWNANISIDSAHTLSLTTFNVSTQNVGSIVLTNVDGSFWTNLNASELRSGTVPNARLTGVTISNAVLSYNSGSDGILIATNTNVGDSIYLNESTSVGFHFQNDIWAGDSGLNNLWGVGSHITSLNGSAIASGTVADGRLSSNVPLMNTSNYFSKNFTYATNQNQIVPDFSIPCQLMTTNAAFTFLAPVGVDLTKTEMQTTAVYVTNTTAVVVNVTAPANCHAVGTMNITNLTRFTFEVYASKFTNCYSVPIF